jgi:3-phosphoglycerate kinase
MIRFIDERPFSQKKVLLRVDFNVSFNTRHNIANDERIRQTIPTIEALLHGTNTLILLSHLGRPKGTDPAFSLKPVAKDLQTYLPKTQVMLVSSLSQLKKLTAGKPSNKHLFLLENIRFFPGEDTNDETLAKDLASLADVYVNDAFSVSHRSSASVVGVTRFLPSYAGLLLKKEITSLEKALIRPKKPLVVILGGAKIDTKIKLIDRLIEIADTVMLGGGIANTFLYAKDTPIGKSVADRENVHTAKRLLLHAKQHNTQLLLPVDGLVANSLESTESTAKHISTIEKNEYILDIGPETEALFGNRIAGARTIIWNGPVGYFENPTFSHGTDFLYYMITENENAFSVVGGGETLSAIAKKEYLEKISHISTGGGAMLEYIENGTLPGIDALKKSTK